MYTLLNARLRNQMYPNTFHIPSSRTISRLQVGEHVKLCFEETGVLSEKMWVKISSINGGNFKGTLENHPFNLKSIKYGDTVSFDSKHILRTM